jgi:hypothetical protein
MREVRGWVFCRRRPNRNARQHKQNCPYYFYGYVGGNKVLPHLNGVSGLRIGIFLLFSSLVYGTNACLGTYIPWAIEVHFLFITKNPLFVI